LGEVPAAQDIFFLTCGTLRAPEFAVGPSVRVSPLRAVRLSLTVGVVVRKNGDVVLVDAGWSEETCAHPVRSMGLATYAYVAPSVKPADSIAAQLKGLGFELARVRTIVATHLHLDHVGGALDFPNAEVVCTDLELAAYRSRKNLGYRAVDLARCGRIRTIAMTRDPSYGFPASHDLFGDGSVVLLDARGHTRGNIAVAMRSAAAAYVHIGDAAYLGWELGLASKGPSLFARLVAWDVASLKRGHSAIRACQADPRSPTIVPSHDREVWKALPHAPVTN
jgi:glyoxylase-like metal-dependent hydrolase (beta-lactamase superfamily II)